MRQAELPPRGGTGWLDAFVTDPVSLSSAIAGKALAGAAAKYLVPPRTLPHLGSPQEKREVYARFSESITRRLVLTQHMAALRRQPIWMLTPLTWARMPDRLVALEQEVLNACWELRLVASPAPFEAGREVVRLFLLVSAAAIDRKADYEAVSDQMAEAQAHFIDVCREELAYEPKWWQWKRRLTVRRHLKKYRDKQTRQRALR